MSKKLDKFIDKLLAFIGSKPSKKQVGLVTSLIVLSFAAGQVYSQQANNGQLDCTGAGNYTVGEYPELHPYYSQELKACVVPEPLDRYNMSVDPGGNNTTNATNVTQ